MLSTLDLSRSLNKHEYKEALSYVTQIDGSLTTLETFLAEAQA